MEGWGFFFLLGICDWSQHNRLSVSAALADVITMDLVIVYTGRQFLVNIVIMKRPRPSKCHAQVVVQSIGAPEGPPPAFDLDAVNAIRMALSV